MTSRTNSQFKTAGITTNSCLTSARVLDCRPFDGCADELLRRRITRLNQDYNLDIVLSDCDEIFQRLQTLDRAKTLSSAIKAFEKEAIRILGPHLHHGSIPRATRNVERDELRSALIRCTFATSAKAEPSVVTSILPSFPTVDHTAASFSTKHDQPYVIGGAVADPCRGGSSPVPASIVDGVLLATEQARLKQPAEKSPELSPKRYQPGEVGILSDLQDAQHQLKRPGTRKSTDDHNQDTMPVREPLESRVYGINMHQQACSSLALRLKICPDGAADATAVATRTAREQDAGTKLENNTCCSQPPDSTSGAVDYVSSKTVENCNASNASRVVSQVQARLENVWPPLLEGARQLPFVVTWELSRVAMHCGVSLAAPGGALAINPQWPHMRYHEFWSSLQSLPLLKNKSFPTKGSCKAWEEALSGKSTGSLTSRGVHYSAEARFVTSIDKPMLTIALKPISLNKTHRLSRQFGSDNFMELLFPMLDADRIRKSELTSSFTSKPHLVKDAIVNWMAHGRHEIFGMLWRFFCSKDATKKVNRFKQGEWAEETVSQRRYYLFCESSGCTRDEMLDWLLNLRTENHHQPVLKLFSRISLGLSRTVPAFVVPTDCIRVMPADLLGDETGSGGSVKKVMNDGCGRISRGLARKIVTMLNLDHSPCAFQARFGSAKGMWVVDVVGVQWDPETDNDSIWIEVYPSQRKWDCDLNDENHRVFEVRNWPSRPVKSASVNTQFLPVLEHGAIDKTAMRACFSEHLRFFIDSDLRRQEAAMQSPSACLLWCNQIRRDAAHLQAEAVTGSSSFGPLLGSFPERLHDQISFLAQHGFHPQKQQFLQELAQKARDEYCKRLNETLKFEIGCSAFLYMIADMWGHLKEGEVHVSFSSTVRDELRGFDDTLLDDCEVLVARAPAHFPSDIQRVRAVHCPQLRRLKDVIVFSTMGTIPLADKLSGGDYDGDMAWVCWDPKIVKNYRNSEVPACPEALQIKREKSTYKDLVNTYGNHSDVITEMVRLGLHFNSGTSILGSLTIYKEQLCYNRRTIADKSAIMLSHLLSHLVDQPKQGIIFDWPEWIQLQKEQGFPRKSSLMKPLFIHGPPPNWKRPPHGLHVNDWLKLEVAQSTIDECRQRFKAMLDPSVTYRDEDIALWSLQMEHQHPHEFDLLKKRLYELKDRWSDGPRQGPAWKRHVRELHWSFGQILPHALGESPVSGSDDGSFISITESSTPSVSTVSPITSSCTAMKSTGSLSLSNSMSSSAMAGSRSNNTSAKAVSCSSFATALDSLNLSQQQEPSAAQLQGPMVPLSQLLLRDLSMPGHDTLSMWALYRAAVAFKLFWSRNSLRRFLWHMCGRELGHIKARASGNPVLITSSCHSVLKVDRRAVAREEGRLVVGGEDDDDYLGCS